MEKMNNQPDDLENIGMGPDCVECGNSTSWLPCWNCGGEGGWMVRSLWRKIRFGIALMIIADVMNVVEKADIIIVLNVERS